MSIQAVKPQPIEVSRMTLKSLIKGKQESPLRVLLYGAEGLGKSTFAAGAPSPIFICTEDGTSHLDIVRFPTPKTWADVLSAISTLTIEKHDFKTLVIDTLDWLEPLNHEHVCKRDGKVDLEAYGYGRGFLVALDAWRIFLRSLEKLRDEKGMNIIFLAHSEIRTFKSPQLEPFDRFQMKLHAKAAGLIKEWCDGLLFCDYEVAIKKDGQKRARGIDTGSRLLHTQWTAAYDAKNRYSLPETLPLDWAEFYNAVHAGQVADPKELRAEIERKAKELGGQLEIKALESIKRNFDDAEKLAALNSWVNVKLTEKEARQ